MGKLSDSAIHVLLRRGTTENRSNLIKNQKLKSDHLLSLFNYTATSDMQQHSQEILDHGQDISSPQVQNQMARASRSIAEKLLKHPAAKHNQFGIKNVHDNLIKKYHLMPEYYKHWYNS